jgi:hypothetical protein
MQLCPSRAHLLQSIIDVGGHDVFVIGQSW